MTNKNRSKSKNNDLSNKMDILLNKFEEVELKLDKRMSKLENKYESIKKNVAKSEKNMDNLHAEVSRMKSRLNMIEQEHLRSDIIVRGLKEIEKSEQELDQLVFYVLNSLSNQIVDSDIAMIKRLGNNSEDKSTPPKSPRPVLVRFRMEKTKEDLMKRKREKNLNCSMITYKEVKIGTATDVIYFGDNLTPLNASLYFDARQLRKKEVVKYAWTKMGSVYVRKDDTSKAIKITTRDQLNAFRKRNVKKVFSSTKRDDSSEEETGDESQSSSSSEPSEAEDAPLSDVDKEAENTQPRKKKRHRSFTPRKSPRPKRTNTQKL